MDRTKDYRDRNEMFKAKHSHLLQVLETAVANQDQRLINRTQSKLKRLENDFLVANQAFTLSEARRYSQMFPQNEADYAQDAALALWNRFLTWDPERGTLSTWARGEVRGAVHRSARRAERPELSLPDYTAAPKVSRAVQQLKHQYQLANPTGNIPEPTPEEIVDFCDGEVTLPQVKRLLIAKPVTLETSASSDPNFTIGSILEAVSETSDGEDNYAFSWDMLAEIADSCRPAALFCFLAETGFAGSEPQSQVTVGQILNLGRETARRLSNEVKTKYAEHVVTTLKLATSSSA